MCVCLTYMFFSTCLSLCVCVSLYVYNCVCVCMFMFVCMYMSVFVYTCVCVYKCMYVCILVYVCLSLCMYKCVCVSVRVPEKLINGGQETEVPAPEKVSPQVASSLSYRLG